jgi:hypothetical protein
MFPLILQGLSLKERERKDYNALVYRVPQNLFNLTFKLQSTNLCKKFTYACAACVKQAVSEY